MGQWLCEIEPLARWRQRFAEPLEVLSPDARRAQAHFFRYREAYIRNVIEREWAADGMLGTDPFIALTRLRDERRVGLDWRPLERLAERASTNRDVHSTNLPGTHAGKAEAQAPSLLQERSGAGKRRRCSKVCRISLRSPATPDQAHPEKGTPQNNQQVGFGDSLCTG